MAAAKRYPACKGKENSPANRRLPCQGCGGTGRTGKPEKGFADMFLARYFGSQR
jgi:DnaJ-class molecular chaperone